MMSPTTIPGPSCCCCSGRLKVHGQGVGCHQFVWAPPFLPRPPQHSRTPQGHTNLQFSKRHGSQERGSGAILAAAASAPIAAVAAARAIGLFHAPHEPPHIGSPLPKLLHHQPACTSTSAADKSRGGPDRGHDSATFN